MRRQRLEISRSIYYARHVLPPSSSASIATVVKDYWEEDGVIDLYSLDAAEQFDPMDVDYYSSYNEDTEAIDIQKAITSWWDAQWVSRVVPSQDLGIYFDLGSERPKSTELAYVVVETGETYQLSATSIVFPCLYEEYGDFIDGGPQILKVHSKDDLEKYILKLRSQLCERMGVPVPLLGDQYSVTHVHLFQYPPRASESTRAFREPIAQNRDVVQQIKSRIDMLKFIGGIFSRDRVLEFFKRPHLNCVCSSSSMGCERIEECLRSCVTRFWEFLQTLELYNHGYYDESVSLADENSFYWTGILAKIHPELRELVPFSEGMLNLLKLLIYGWTERRIAQLILANDYALMDSVDELAYPDKFRSLYSDGQPLQIAFSAAIKTLLPTNLQWFYSDFSREPGVARLPFTRVHWYAARRLYFELGAALSASTCKNVASLSGGIQGNPEDALQRHLLDKISACFRGFEFRVWSNFFASPRAKQTGSTGSAAGGTGTGRIRGDVDDSGWEETFKHEQYLQLEQLVSGEISYDSLPDLYEVGEQDDYSEKLAKFFESTEYEISIPPCVKNIMNNIATRASERHPKFAERFALVSFFRGMGLHWIRVAEILQSQFHDKPELKTGSLLDFLKSAEYGHDFMNQAKRLSKWETRVDESNRASAPSGYNCCTMMSQGFCPIQPARIADIEDIEGGGCSCSPLSPTASNQHRLRQYNCAMKLSQEANGSVNGREIRYIKHPAQFMRTALFYVSKRELPKSQQ